MDTNQTVTPAAPQPPFSSTSQGVMLATHVAEELVVRLKDQSSAIRYAHRQGAFNQASIEEAHSIFGTALTAEGMAAQLEQHAGNARQKLSAELNGTPGPE